MSDARIQTFAEFWPYYIGEHRDPTCRRLHFAGTTTFFGILIACLVARPLLFGLATVASFGLAFVTFRMEARRSSAPVLLAIIALCALANPAILSGVVVAYGFAWAGHFLVEKNRPATFTYPMWSLAGDFRMWSELVRGRLWSGDGSEIAGPVSRPVEPAPGS
jgi:hypothetical protein